MCFIVAVFGLISACVLYIKCDTLNIAGVNRPYLNRQDLHLSFPIYLYIYTSITPVRPSIQWFLPSIPCILPFVHPSVPLSIELSIRASAPSSIRPSVRPCVLPSLTLTPDFNPPLRHPSIPFICPSAPLSRRLLLRYSINSTRPPLHPSVCVSVSLSIRPSVRLFVPSSIRPLHIIHPSVPPSAGHSACSSFIRRLPILISFQLSILPFPSSLRLFQPSYVPSIDHFFFSQFMSLQIRKNNHLVDNLFP